MSRSAVLYGIGVIIVGWPFIGAAMLRAVNTVAHSAPWLDEDRWQDDTDIGIELALWPINLIVLIVMGCVGVVHYTRKAIGYVRRYVPREYSPMRLYRQSITFISGVEMRDKRGQRRKRPIAPDTGPR